MRSLKAPVLWPQSDKAHWELCSFTNPCINCLGRLRRQNTSIFLELIYVPSWSQKNTNPMRDEDPVEKIHACITNLAEKANGSTCSSQKWHPRRRVDVCQSNHIDQGSAKFFEEGHISCCTTVRGPDILCIAIFSRYVILYQFNTFLVNILFFHYWQNVFCGRVKWHRRSNLGFGP